MDPDECRRRFAAADHAYLATAGADGVPHLVPVVFDLTGDRIAVVVDHKRKRTQDLRRLRTITENPVVCLLADHYDEDWDRLWWVRADGTARVVRDGPEREEAVDRLVGRHPPYAARRPTGPAIVVDVHRWVGWAAGPRP